MAYDLRDVNVPRLVGRPLVALAKAVENPATRHLLAKRMLADLGIERVREMTFDEVPTMYPFVEPESRRGRPTKLETIAKHEVERPGFRFRTAAEYAQAYRNGESSPVDVARRVLAAMRTLDKADPPLRAIIAVDEAEIMQAAHDSADRIAAGNALGPLDGVPIAVKDELDQFGYPTTVGTAFIGKHPAQKDATVVARLRAAGALLIGKANMHEIGIGVTGFNPHHGPARNPYDPGHYTGGSSSGSAAAVAAGLCPIAVGADGGGSIRIPASLCGVFGLKATFGRVPETGAYPLCWSVAHVGPIAATATDLALGYAVMAGADPDDRFSTAAPPVSMTGWTKADLKGIRIGIYKPWFEHAGSDIVGACHESLARLQERGAKVVEIDIPDLESLRVGHLITIVSEMAQSMNALYEEHRTDFGLDVRVNLALGRTLTGRDYVQAQRIRTHAMDVFGKVFRDVHMIATPTSGCTAPSLENDVLSHGESDLTTLGSIIRFAAPGNFVGMPGVSIPVGYDREGLPIGLQLMGRHWSEALLLRAACILESEIERRGPSVYVDLL